MSAKGQPTPSPGWFRLCGRLQGGRARRSHNPGQTGSAPSSDRPRAAVGRANPRAQHQHRAPESSPTCLSGNKVLPEPAQQWPIWKELSRRCCVQAEGGNPHGRRPQLPSEWGRHPLPDAHARLAPKTQPTDPKRQAKDGSAPDTQCARPEGLTLSQRRTTLPSVLAVSWTGASPWLPRPGWSVVQGGSPGPSASCLPAPTGSAPGGGGWEATPCPQPGG